MQDFKAKAMGKINLNIVNKLTYLFYFSVIGVWKKLSIYAVFERPIVLRFVNLGTGKMATVKFVKILLMDLIQNPNNNHHVLYTIIMYFCIFNVFSLILPVFEFVFFVLSSNITHTLITLNL